MFDVNDKIKEFKAKYKDKCFALVGWKNLQMKNYGLNEMLECICNSANGSLQEMANIIERLTAKNKVFGRSQVYADKKTSKIDLIRDENGKLQLSGYDSVSEIPLKGQHQKRNPKIFRKSDDMINKNFQRAEERIMDLGEKVRELFPGEDKQFITFAMRAIRKYAQEKKIHTDKIIKALKNGRYTLDTDLWKVIPNVVKENNKHTIVINESDLERVVDMMEMTEQKFYANIRHFISTLLQDPVNAKVPSIFAQRNITRSTLLNYLLGGKDPILIRDEKISDKDENGEPKTATMMVKFRCPKKNFDRKLEKLYIKMFEKNLPPRKHNQQEEDVDEATGCGGNGAAGGAFVTPIFGVQRRQMPTEIGESTTTTNVGNYTYDAPVLGDKETLARHDGECGSISVNHIKSKK